MKRAHLWWMIVVLPGWIFGGFLIAQLLVGGLLWSLSSLPISPLAAINENLLTTAVAALIYLVTLGIVIGLPWIIKKRRVTLHDLGLHRLPSWTDILTAPAGLVVYFVISTALIYLATVLLAGFDVSEAQNTGFESLGQRYEYILAFLTLVVIAPVAEEILFRGYLFGNLKKFVPIWIAILVTSLLFGFIHGAWNVAIDTFALSIMLCLLRLWTGSLWAPILLHMTKNGIAFYFLFINPTLLNTLGG